MPGKRKNEQKQKQIGADAMSDMTSGTTTIIQKRTKERRQGHMKDALAAGGEEGRDKLR